MSEPAPAIGLRDVRASYGGPPVLERVNLSVAARDFVAVIGPNGGGKTTLLRLALGLLHPEAGEVTVLGQPPERACRRVGYVPQEAAHDAQFPATVDEVVLMGRLGRAPALGPYRQHDRDHAHKALDKVGLGDQLGRRFSALSGGQRQRALIARALAAEPELLLLDEPTASIDLAARAEFFELLETLNERLAIVMVSHDLSLVSERVQSCVCVGHGEAVLHPTGELTGDTLAALWGGDVRLVRHNHRCAEEGHKWPGS